jgi:hypothetical protein
MLRRYYSEIGHGHNDKWFCRVDVSVFETHARLKEIKSFLSGYTKSITTYGSDWSIPENEVFVETMYNLNENILEEILHSSGYKPEWKDPSRSELEDFCEYLVDLYGPASQDISELATELETNSLLYLGSCWHGPVIQKFLTDLARLRF